MSVREENKNIHHIYNNKRSTEKYVNELNFEQLRERIHYTHSISERKKQLHAVKKTLS